MKPVPADILASLAKRFGYHADQLKHLGGGREDSDGITYKTERAGVPFVLKIVGASAKDPDSAGKIEARAAFFSYLGEHGVDVVAPVVNDDGHLIEMCDAGDERFIAYTYPFLTGVHPDPSTWTEETLIAWGRTIGRAHRLTQSYPVWAGFPSSATGKTLLNWQQEVDGFHQWCSDGEVKTCWLLLKDRLEKLPFTRETGGFIHNDPHMQNVLVDGGRVKLLDFDVANCHFFACDVAIAIQSVLFTTAGGMERPVDNRDALTFFVDALLKGYREAMDVPGDFLDQVELFIAYRRALLFTVMGDWLASQPELFAAWKRRVLDEPKVLA